MTVSPRPILAAAAAAALLTAGCGEKKDVTTGAAAPAVKPQTVSVRESEYKIRPAAPRIAAPGTVKFQIRNAGKRTHAFEIDGPGGEQASKAVGPGKTGTLTATLRAGSYEFYCPIDGHRKKGMKGKFKVAGKASAGGGSTTTTPKPKSNQGGGSRYY